MNLSSYVVINKSLAKVGSSIVARKLAPEARKGVAQIRIKEEPFQLTEHIRRASAAVTAHDLNQYRRVIHTIKLQESSTSWLEWMLSEAAAGDCRDTMSGGKYEVQRYNT